LDLLSLDDISIGQTGLMTIEQSHEEHETCGTARIDCNLSDPQELGKQEMRHDYEMPDPRLRGWRRGSTKKVRQDYDEAGTVLRANATVLRSNA
jgi:hypothetical protein